MLKGLLPEYDGIVVSDRFDWEGDKTKAGGEIA